MKRFVLLPLVALASLALAGPPIAVKIGELLDKPDTFNEKEVKTSGVVEEFHQRVSKIGNPYFVFKVEEKEKQVNVFGRGKLQTPLKSGQLVEIVGTFRKQKMSGGNVFKNEIEVTTKTVKVLKPE